MNDLRANIEARQSAIEILLKEKTRLKDRPDELKQTFDQLVVAYTDYENSIAQYQRERKGAILKFSSNRKDIESVHPEITQLPLKQMIRDEGLSEKLTQLKEFLVLQYGEHGVEKDVSAKSIGNLGEDQKKLQRLPSSQQDKKASSQTEWLSRQTLQK